MAFSLPQMLLTFEPDFSTVSLLLPQKCKQPPPCLPTFAGFGMVAACWTRDLEAYVASVLCGESARFASKQPVTLRYDLRAECCYGVTDLLWGALGVP